MFNSSYLVKLLFETKPVPEITPVSVETFTNLSVVNTVFFEKDI